MGADRCRRCAAAGTGTFAVWSRPAFRPDHGAAPLRRHRRLLGQPEALDFPPRSRGGSFAASQPLSAPVTGKTPFRPDHGAAPLPRGRVGQLVDSVGTLSTPPTETSSTVVPRRRSSVTGSPRSTRSDAASSVSSAKNQPSEPSPHPRSRRWSHGSRTVSRCSPMPTGLQRTVYDELGVRLTYHPSGEVHVDAGDPHVLGVSCRRGEFNPKYMRCVARDVRDVVATPSAQMKHSEPRHLRRALRPLCSVKSRPDARRGATDETSASTCGEASWFTLASAIR
jgi:hypothetical protein